MFMYFSICLCMYDNSYIVRTRHVPRCFVQYWFPRTSPHYSTLYSYILSYIIIIIVSLSYAYIVLYSCALILIYSSKRHKIPPATSQIERERKNLIAGAAWCRFFFSIHIHFLPTLLSISKSGIKYFSRVQIQSIMKCRNGRTVRRCRNARPRDGSLAIVPWINGDDADDADDAVILHGAIEIEFGVWKWTWMSMCGHDRRQGIRKWT